MIPTVGSFLSFFRAVFTGAAATVGGLLVTAGQALTRLGQRLKGLNQPTAQGFQPAPAPAPSAPTVQPGAPGFRPNWAGLPAPSASAARPNARPLPGEAPTYSDGIDYKASSSWIAGINFRPVGGVAGGISRAVIGGRLSVGATRTYLTQKGDLTMVLINPSRQNTSGRYTYPRVPRAVMNSMVLAPSKGRFYWWGYHGSSALRTYSNRASIGRRMIRQGRFLKANPHSRHKATATKSRSH